jgi:hypothetical protein
VKVINILKICLVLVTVVFFGAGCAPEVGSEAWCNKMAEKPKGDWTANEAKEYTKNCIFK